MPQAKHRWRPILRLVIIASGACCYFEERRETRLPISDVRPVNDSTFDVVIFVRQKNIPLFLVGRNISHNLPPPPCYIISIAIQRHRTRYYANMLLHQHLLASVGATVSPSSVDFHSAYAGRGIRGLLRW